VKVNLIWFGTFELVSVQKVAKKKEKDVVVIP